MKKGSRLLEGQEPGDLPECVRVQRRRRTAAGGESHGKEKRAEVGSGMAFESYQCVGIDTCVPLEAELGAGGGDRRHRQP